MRNPFLFFVNIKYCDRAFLFYDVIMPKFQSRLFNWIDRSLPAKLGRSARRFFDQKFEELSFEELPRLLAYQVAKAALYPVYLIASTLKRTFPGLNSGQGDAKLRSQPDLGEFLQESSLTSESLENATGQKAAKKNATEKNIDLPELEIPLTLRPLAKFLHWLDRTKIRLDQNIAAIIKRQPDKLATSEHLELEPRLLANLMFAKIWQNQVEQYNVDQKESKELKASNGLAEDVALGKNTKLEQLRNLIAAAIAYFIGKQLSQPILDETSDMIISSESVGLTMEDMFGNDNGPWPHPLEYESHAFNKSPDRDAINSSGELQNFETTTTQISQDRVEGGLMFEEELLMYQQEVSESDRPLRAWIEANATILGYVYNPVMTVVLWVDAIVVKIEDLIIAFWQGLINFPKRLIYFIRYGNRD